MVNPAFLRALLDDVILSLTNMVGNEETLPPQFLSEMVFADCSCSIDAQEELDFDQTKSLYWRKSFAIERVNPL